MNAKRHSEATQPADPRSTGGRNHPHDGAMTTVASISSKATVPVNAGLTGGLAMTVVTSPNSGREILNLDESVKALQPIAPLDRRRVFTHLVATAHLYATEVVIRALLGIRARHQEDHPGEEEFVIFHVVRGEETKKLVESCLKNLGVQPRFRITTWETLAENIEHDQHPRRIIVILDMDSGSPSELMLSVALLIRLARTQDESIQNLHLIDLSADPTLSWCEYGLEGLAVTQLIRLPYSSPTLKYSQMENETSGTDQDMLPALASHLARSVYFEDWQQDFPSACHFRNVVIICPVRPTQAFRLMHQLARPPFFSRTIAMSLRDRPPQFFIITANTWLAKTMDQIQDALDKHTLVLFVDPDLRFLPELRAEVIWVIPGWKSQIRLDTDDIMVDVREMIPRTKEELGAMLRFCGTNSCNSEMRVLTPYPARDSAEASGPGECDHHWDRDMRETLLHLIGRFPENELRDLMDCLRMPSPELTQVGFARLCRQGFIMDTSVLEGSDVPIPIFRLTKRGEDMRRFLSKWNKISVAYLLSRITPQNTYAVNRTLLNLAAIANMDDIQGMVIRVRASETPLRYNELQHNMRGAPYKSMCQYGHLWHIMAAQDGLTNKDIAADENPSIGGTFFQLYLVKHKAIDRYKKQMASEVQQLFKEDEASLMGKVEVLYTTHDTDRIQEEMIIAFLFNLIATRTSRDGGALVARTVVSSEDLQVEEPCLIDQRVYDSGPCFATCLGFVRTERGIAPEGLTLVDKERVYAALVELWGKEVTNRLWVAGLIYIN